MIEHAPNPCATCGRCCRSYVVPICGYDAWLISTRQHLAPEDFLVVYPQKRPGWDGFQLEPDGPRHSLALDKQGPFRPKQPCVFLIELGGGHARCGIYFHRPVVCQTYPMEVWDGVVVERADALCPPGSWPAAMVAQPAWRAAQQRLRMHYDLYYEVVARWNARVADAAPGTSFGVPEYFSYLLNVYDRLARLTVEVGATALATIEATWAVLPERTGPGPLRVSTAEHPWLDYLSRARDLIDAFYPAIPPQPSITLRRALTAATEERALAGE